MNNSLTKSEWAVMSALWKKPRQTVSGIINTMGSRMDWKYNTYVTYIKRMCEKGLIGYDQLGRDKFYFPLVREEECILAESRSMLEKMDGRVAKEFLVCMIKGSGLGEKDRAELKALLDDLNTGFQKSQKAFRGGNKEGERP
jgi:BlaI family penicillinase repressor